MTTCWHHLHLSAGKSLHGLLLSSCLILITKSLSSFPKKGNFWASLSPLWQNYKQIRNCSFQSSRFHENISSEAEDLLISNCTVKVIRTLTVIPKSWVFLFLNKIETQFPCQEGIGQNIILLKTGHSGNAGLILLYRQAFVFQPGKNSALLLHIINTLLVLLQTVAKLVL